MRELYVYWKLPRVQLAPALRAAAAMQSTLRDRHPGLAARLLQRAGETGERATVMETYARPGTGVDPALQADIEAFAAVELGPWCVDGRHVEVFEAIEA